MKRWKITLMILTIFTVLSACDKLPIETNMSEDVHEFSFTNQDNESVSLQDYEGEWWVADFIFTNCTTVCLPMTSNLKSLQDKMKNNNISVSFVSFSVDPEHDTTDVLKSYGEEYDVDFSSWNFLTGYDFKTIRELSIKSFRAMIKEPEYGDDQVMHDTRFFLINPEGEIVKGYDGVKPVGSDELLEDLLTLNKNNLL